MLCLALKAVITGYLLNIHLVLPAFRTVWQGPDLCITIFCHWKVHYPHGLNACLLLKKISEINGIQHFPLMRSICCDTKESSTMNLGVCSEAECRRRWAQSITPIYRISSCPYWTLPRWRVDLWNLLDKLLFCVMRSDTVLAGHVFSSQKGSWDRCTIYFKDKQSLNISFLWKNFCRLYALELISPSRKSHIIQSN